ncbi:conjugal transfer protein TraF [Enterobacter hormaechei]
MYKEFHIEASENSASGVKVWILTAMVVLLMSIVSFLTVRLINTVDETEAAVQSVKEVQASQGEVIKGLQRDRNNTDREIERLRNQVDRLKDENAALKAKVGIPLSLNTKPPSGGFFVSADRAAFKRR